MAEWTTLRQLQPGAVFRTKAEILAVKSEYRYSYGQGQSECILCASGEYAHFPRANETEVQEIPLALIEAAPDLLEACELMLMQLAGVTTWATEGIKVAAEHMQEAIQALQSEGMTVHFPPATSEECKLVLGRLEKNANP